jgi:hypothetical protein
LAGRGGVGFPVTLHRSCPRLCACPVLAAGDSLSAGVWSKLWDQKKNSPYGASPPYSHGMRKEGGVG